MVDGRDRSAAERRRGEATKTNGMDMRVAATARPTAPAARAVEDEPTMLPTEMEIHTVRHMEQIATMAVWCAKRGTPIITKMPHGIIEWATTPDIEHVIEPRTVSLPERIGGQEVRQQQQQQQDQQYGNFMAPPPRPFQMQTMLGMQMPPQ